jgi:hypothetical protein
MTRNTNGNGVIARANKVGADAVLSVINNRGDSGVDRSNDHPRDTEDIDF